MEQFRINLSNIKQKKNSRQEIIFNSHIGVKSIIESKFIEKLDIKEIENLREFLDQSIKAKKPIKYLNKNMTEP